MTPVSSTPALLSIAISAVAVLLFLIIRLRMHAFVALTLVSLATALVAGLPADQVVDVLYEGFGSTLAAVALLVIAVVRARTVWWAVGLGLILGGAIGNLIDRLFSPPGFGIGHVTDFLAYGTWFIGNLADVALGAGVIVLAGVLWARRRAATAQRADTATDGPEPVAEVQRP